MLKTIVIVANTVTIFNDPGGKVNDYIRAVDQYKQEQKRVEIVGYCGSACTVFLEIACVHPEATLAFHAAQSPPEIPEPAATLAEQYTTKLMVEKYPPALRVWFHLNAADKQGEDQYVTLSGKEVIELGAPEC